ncbi:MAG TPA: alpha/beta fold hydrolase [Terriglobales bacterium]
MASADRKPVADDPTELWTQPTRGLMTRVLALLLVGTLLSGCAKQLLSCPRMAKVPEPPAPTQRPAGVLFATDRKPQSDPDPDLTFSSDLNFSDPRVSYGARCKDPGSGNEAQCDEPAWLNQALPASLTKQQFMDAIRAGNSDVLLFVHGFYFSFDESLEMAVRLTERTGLQAIPVAYSWPSLAKLSAYGSDYDRNEWAIDHIQAFIADLVEAIPPGHVLHIVAHSMGNRAVLWALARLTLPQDRLGQLIMIAPDVDTEVFEDLVLRSGPFARRTLYASTQDLALRASGWLRSGTPRAGDARKQFVVFKDMDTIDASPVKAGMIGHSLYDYSQLIFDDVGATLRDKPISERNLTACTVKSIAGYNAEHGTSLPDTVYRLPGK